MGPENRAKLTSYLQIGFLAGVFAGSANQLYLDRLRADFERCSEVYTVGDRSVLSYSAACEDNHFQRGIQFRDGMAPSELLPDMVEIPAVLNDCQGRESHDMYTQIGPTCYLTCVAAAISDLSERQGGPAIDPFYLSDMIALQGAYLLPEKADDLDDINTSADELARIDTIDLGNGLVFKVEPNLLTAVPDSARNTPGKLDAYIASLMEDSRSHLIYSTTVDENMRHAVLILGQRIDDVTGVPYLLVAEPNGGGIEHSPTFPLIQDDWLSLAPHGDFLMRIDITPESVALVTDLTRITLVDPEK